MTTSAENKWKRNAGGVLLGAVAASYFAAPMIALADPVALFGGGIALGLALLGLYNVHVVRGVDREMIWFAYGSGAVALITLGIAFAFAIAASNRLEPVCDRLQREILDGRSAAPAGDTASPPHDAFVALRCRPR